jgi:hypothetical protein
LTSGSARPDLAAHTTVSGSYRLGSNWNVDPRLTFATDTSGSSVAAVYFGQFGGPLGARPADPNLDMLPAGDCDCHVAIVALESDSKVPGTGWLSPYS